MSSSAAGGNDGFWIGLVHACLPLAIWAAHFFGSYVFVAVGCHAGLDTRNFAGIPLLTLGLAGATVIALLALAWILLQPSRLRAASGAGSGDGPIGAAFRRGAAGLSLVAVAWTGVPVVLLRACVP
jgi:hypothetical protein